MIEVSKKSQLQKIDDAAREMAAFGRAFYARGWNLATSSNYSAVVDTEPLLVLMTASGTHKGELSTSDFILVDEQLTVIEPVGRHSSTKLKPSAEAALHLAIARQNDVGAVLHTHSVWSTILSERFAATGAIALSGYEMLKALKGVKTHATTVQIPILENSQEMDKLADTVKDLINRNQLEHGFVLKGHGLYTWADSLAAARNQVEALEFLFEVVGRSGGT